MSTGEHYLPFPRIPHGRRSGLSSPREIFWNQLRRNRRRKLPRRRRRKQKARLTQGLRATAPMVDLSSAGNPTVEPNITSIGKPVARSYGHFCISKMAVSRHLGFYRTENSAIRSADLENPELESNMEWIGCTSD